MLRTVVPALDAHDRPVLDRHLSPEASVDGIDDKSL
jgi:hypothetical protein